MSITMIVALCLCGIGLIACEAIIPGGIAGTIGVIMTLAGIVGAFGYGIIPGFAALLLALIGGLIGVAMMLRILPKTKHGKVLCLSEDQKGFSAAGEKAPAQVGEKGKAETMLRPAGVVDIDGRRVDVVTRGDYINPGTNVRVVEVSGSRVVVEEIG